MSPVEGAPKSAWRVWARQARLAVDWPMVGLAVRAALRHWLAARPPGTVLLYLATPVEADVAPLAEDPALAHLGFAVTRTGPDGLLTLHPASSPRERHAFGFEHPVAGAEVVADENVSVVLVPGLAFDPSGGRLGHGGGYYDRLLARLGPGPTRVGVTAEALVVPGSPLGLEAHDEHVDLLVTEAGLRPVTRVSRRPTGSAEDLSGGSRRAGPRPR